MDIDFNEYQLRSLEAINVVLGKNGCGKSRLLRSLEAAHRDNAHVRYISPERGGELAFNANVLTQIEANPTWLSDERRRNLATQFRQASFVEFRRLETLVLRQIEKTPKMPCLTSAPLGQMAVIE
jgi:ABC-type cobalamin/Fe3+-siderophores transport system ATPase subunit